MDPKEAIWAARKADEHDPLAKYRSQFVIADPDLIYLDGNSLGRLPKRTAAMFKDVVEGQWGNRLVRAWSEHWIKLPKRIGGKIAQVIGARDGEVIVSDSTSVNFYKLTMAALRARPGRKRIVTDSANFPSDVYLLQGCAQMMGCEILIVEPEEVPGALDSETALLTLSHTSFKSGLIHPMVELTQRAHALGALTLWDLSHSVGVVPVSLNDAGADLAVGCTYKYLNGGPGAPAFLYVREDLQSELVNPIWGWFGQKNPFDFSLEYEPNDGIGSFLAGTPPILSMAAIEVGVDLVLEARLANIRKKSILQTELAIGLVDQFLEPHGVTLNSPRDAQCRGSHVSLGHANAFQIDQALIAEMNVIPDFRRPDNIRLGISPLYTSFEEVAESILRIKQVLESKSYEKYPDSLPGVT